MQSVLRRGIWILSLSGVLIGCTGHSRAPVSDLGGKYESVSRGSYRGSFYEVQKGDTLYFISYVTNKDVKELIRLNNLKSPYTIHPGDRLNLWRSVYAPPSYAGSGSGEAAAATTVAAASASPKPEPAKATTKKPASSTNNSAQKTANKKVEQSKPKEYGESKGKQNVNNTKPNTAKQTTVASQPKKPPAAKVSSWVWPTKGRVIKNFSVGDQGNKGIDIAGQRGQAIVATAGGTVVYSGNALRGYGNLVIVKHNDNYLSAYAHNDRLLVSEGQSVKSGQKIATMGSSGSNSVRLHFEIRYQGKSVNPKRYLP
ncbi:hypothetical protein BCU70_07490 [Vibrio sp. 10N.286.49.C2]|uniref:peptidoglycan DD-metalloendopeptidase family protein n=1 Tax=unclassified Vibrio TaxID=2614977 RepID=UPI000C82CDF7|nr:MULTISPECIES: peptidoglycan DD-metalloendopeptidase family protein [unclassified Vibrio]PMH29485.1 hypothetical protein BCU70_07490 [Vibrio sp. 10N.286.49.C2]PMH56000.1 hypothetical protein BCU66_07400 [Vibrio sp. 10N.286.49.B1]PMH77744.1 hypothetical protein BCU58_11910 [Vibrio sp. 10N.286.48.B7]